MSGHRRRRRIMRSLKIEEISGVDVPAQEGAKALIMKRHAGDPDGADAFDKQSALTSPEDGHSHLLSLNIGPDGVELNSGFTDNAEGHRHPWVRMTGGEIVIGTARRMIDGRIEGEPHIHRVAFMSKGDAEKRDIPPEERERLVGTGGSPPDGSFLIANKDDLRNAIQAFGRAKDKKRAAGHIRRRAKALGATDLLPKEGALSALLKEAGGEAGDVGTEEDTMTDKTDDAAVKDLQEQLAKANQMAALTDAEKTYHGALGALDETDARAFLTKSSDERRIVMDAEAKKVDEAKKRAQEDDPVEYTTLDGIELRKSMGIAFVTMARSNDELRKRLDESEGQRKQAALEKRADDELSHLPGTREERAAILKALEGIEDVDQRKTALGVLKAQNDFLAPAFGTQGYGGPASAVDSVDEALEKMAKQYQETHEDLTIEQAYSKVVRETEEGRRLYARSVDEPSVN